MNARLRLTLGLLALLVLPTAQALWVGLGPAHGASGHTHGHTHGHGHAHPERSHPGEAALETSLHGHHHDEGTVPHDHSYDPTLRPGPPWPAASPLAAAEVPGRPAYEPIGAPPGVAPAASPGAAPLRYLHCSLLI